MTEHPEAAAQRVGLALVGLGQLTTEELIPAIRNSRHARIAALVTDDLEEGARFARAFDLTEADVYRAEELEALQDRPDVEAVYIVLPNSLHREYTERAARIGKHVLCEKPLATNAAEAQAMVDACRAAGVLLMTAYRCQYTPEHWAARTAVQSGQLGAIKVLDSIHTQVETDPGAWRLKRALAGGGPLPDVGLYSINTMRFVLGQEPEWVFARLHAPLDDPRFAEVEESMALLLGFPGGVMATALTSYGAHKTTTLRVLGEEGSVLLDPAFTYSGLKLTITRPEGRWEPQCGPGDQFMLEIDHFAQRVRDGGQPWTPGEEGVQDHRIMDALYESARLGQPVRLDGPAGRDVYRGTLPEQGRGQAAGERPG